MLLTSLAMRLISSRPDLSQCMLGGLCHVHLHARPLTSSPCPAWHRWRSGTRSILLRSVFVCLCVCFNSNPPFFCLGTFSFFCHCSAPSRLSPPDRMALKLRLWKCTSFSGLLKSRYLRFSFGTRCHSVLGVVDFLFD